MNNINQSIIRMLMLFFGLSAFTATVEAQKFRYSLPGLDSLEETFIVSGGSSTVLREGEAEIINNNTLTSFWLALHESNDNSPILDRFRQTQFVSDLYGYYGVSGSGRWDLGLHLRYIRTRTDNAATSSMFKVFESEREINEDDPTDILDNSVGGLSAVGVRFRYKPLRLDPKLVVSGGIGIKTITGETKARLLAADRNTADIGITYYKGLTKNTYYFVGATGQIFFPNKDVNDIYQYVAGANFFLIQRTTNNKFTFYPGLTYSLIFRPSQSAAQSHSLIKTAEFVLAYAGIQYAPNTNYNFFLIGGFPLISNLTNPRQEIVRQSYSTLALGFRVGI